MTVNELIAELQVLAAQGHGELDIAIYKEELSDWTTDIEPSCFEPCIPKFGYIKQGKRMGLTRHVIIDTID